MVFYHYPSLDKCRATAVIHHCPNIGSSFPTSLSSVKVRYACSSWLITKNRSILWSKIFFNSELSSPHRHVWRISSSVIIMWDHSWIKSPAVPNRVWPSGWRIFLIYRSYRMICFISVSKIILTRAFSIGWEMVNPIGVTNDDVTFSNSGDQFGGTIYE